MSVTSDTAEVFDFGRVMTHVTGLIGRNFVPFFLLSLVFTGLPTLLIFGIQLSMLPDPTLGPQGMANAASAMGAYGVTGVVLMAILAMLPAYVLQAALTRASIDDLGGKGVSIGSAVQAGLRYLFPLLGLAIIVSLGIMAGLIVFIVPGIILAICWIVSSPVLVVEKVGLFQAMQRSLALTRNHRWALFGFLVLLIIALAIVSIVMGAAMAGTMGGFGAQGLGAKPSIGVGIIQALVGSLEVMVTTVGIAAIYFELRRIKEGVGVTELASVFD